MPRKKKDAMSDTDKLQLAIANLSKLPEYSFAKLPSSGETIMVLRGQAGYMSVTPGTYVTNDPEVLNTMHHITRFQAEAMLNGSMYGWHIPGADIDYLWSLEQTKKSSKTE